MKYLKLYESFESSTISSVIKYLETKVDKRYVQIFKGRLLKMQESLDIPLSDIKDENVKYLNRKKALTFKSEDKVDSTKGIYCLKFWFSLEEGYMGFTSTGNNVINYKESQRRNERREKNDPFSANELEHIKNEIGVTTGSLKPLKNYDDLKHGQIIFGIFSDDYDDIDRLAMAKIWRDGNSLFAIQNVAAGGEPDYDLDGESWRSWLDGDKFRYSWSLDSVDSPGNDHGKLHIYTPSDEPIFIEGLEKEEPKVEEENPLDYNLPTNSRFSVGSWNEYDWSIDDPEQINKSDFAVVLIIDDLLKSNIKPVSSTKKEREESREGALKLKSDDYIKNQNIERYMTQVISKTINIDTTELKDLEKIVIKTICGKFAFISIFKNRPDIDNISDISNYLYRAIRQDDIEDKKYYLSSAIQKYKSVYSSSNEYSIEYEKSLNFVNKYGSDELKKAFDLINQISDKIINYLKSQKIETIQDLKMIYIKLDSIYKICRYTGFEVEGVLRAILNDFHDPSDVNYYSQREYEDNGNLDKLKQIERYIDSILR